jgi:DNA-binding transcriptional MerR regulator
VISVFGIAELERLSGVSRTAIHWYLRQGVLLRPQKTATGRNLYTEDHIAILKRIQKLRESGRTLREIEVELGPELKKADSASVDLAAEDYRRTHDSILLFASTQFSAKGYKDTHVTTIINHLGITANVFYSHFPSKRALLAECINAVFKASLEYVKRQLAPVQDPGERALWLVFGYLRVLELGASAVSLVLLEGAQTAAELMDPLRGMWREMVGQVSAELSDGSARQVTQLAVPDEILSYSLFAAFDQTVRRYGSGTEYSRRELMRTHLWLFLAVLGAACKEIDIDSRLVRYEPLIDRFARMPQGPSLSELLAPGIG